MEDGKNWERQPIHLLKEMDSSALLRIPLRAGVRQFPNKKGMNYLIIHPFFDLYFYSSYFSGFAFLAISKRSGPMWQYPPGFLSK